jgi:hypothetical protein
VRVRGAIRPPTPQPRYQTPNSKATRKSRSNCFAVNSTDTVMRNMGNVLCRANGSTRRTAALNDHLFNDPGRNQYLLNWLACLWSSAFDLNSSRFGRILLGSGPQGAVRFRGAIIAQD